MVKKIEYIIFSLVLLIVISVVYLKREKIKSKIRKYTDKTDLTKLFLSMQKNMEKRFLTIDHAPIILAVDFPIDLSFGNEIVSEDANNCKYFINEQCVIVSCQASNCEEVVRVLSHFFSKAFHSLCFSISDTNELKKIESIFFSLKSIASIETAIFLFYRLNFENTIDKYGPFGFTIERYITSQILESISQTQNDIFHAALCDSRIFNKIPPAIFQLSSIEENIETACNIFSDDIKGVFFYDSKELVETVFQKIVYSECSYAKSVGAIHNIVQNFFYFIQIIAYLLFTFLFFRYSLILFKSYKQISHSIQNVKKAKSFLKAEEVSEFLKISTIKYSPVVEVASSSNIEEIQNFQNNLLAVLVEEVKKRDKVLFKPFYCQPCDTDNFFDLNQNINEVCRVYKIVKPFDQAENYKQIFSDKVIFLFEEFFKGLENYKLFTYINELSDTLEKLLNKNTNVFENTCKLKEIMIEVKHIQQSFLNKWIFDFHDEKYSTLLVNIKKAFGSQLVEHIERLKKQYLDLLISRIENCEFIGLEKVFEIKNSQIYLSSQFNNFLNTIIYILQSNQPEEIKQTPNKCQFIFWDLEKINQAISLLKETQQINTNKNLLLEKIAALVCFENLKSKLLNSQQNRDSYTLKEMALNTAGALEKVKALFQDLQKEQQRDFYKELVEIFKNNFNLIAEDFMKEASSILTIYTKLEKWNDKDNLVFFLFNVQKEELNYTVEKIIAYLVDLNNNVLALLIKNSDFFKNRVLMEYMYKQISSYEKGELNNLSAIEGLLKSLKGWQIKWRPLEEQTASPKEYIKYHFENFRNMIISQTNKIFFEESKIIFNNLVQIFNQKLSGRFPFGTGPKVNLTDLTYFSNLYQNQKERLVQDKILLDISFVKDTLNKFNEILEFFTLEGNNLSHAVYIQSHYKKEESCQFQNDNLIMKYTYSFSNQKYQKDNVETRMYIKDNFCLNIRIANSSVFKISPIDSHNVLKSLEDPNFTIRTDAEGYSIDFSFSNYFTFFRFVYKFLFLIKKEFVILKIVIPIENKNDSNDKSEVITYIRIDNFPLFPGILFEIK